MGKAASNALVRQPHFFNRKAIMDIQYWHWNPHKAKDTRYTIAVDVPPKEAFEDLLLNKFSTLRIPVGITKCHPQDNYVKSVGRQQAFAMIHSRFYQIYRVDHEKDGTVKFILFTKEDGTIPSYFNQIVLEYKHDRKRVYFLGC
jgi:hypothetical protein